MGFLVALSGLLFPGLAHGLTSHPRSMVVWCVAGLAALGAMLVTPWGLIAYFAIGVASMIDMIIRIPRPYRWSLAALAAGLAPIIGSMVLRVVALEAFKIPASSMYPTLEIGDHIFVNKLARSPERGEIVVFHQPCEPERDYIKRVIAVANDTVEVRCNIVYVNGKVLANSLVDANCTYRDYNDSGGGGDRWYDRTCSRYHETLDGHEYDVFHDAERPARDATGKRGDGKDFPQDNILRGCANIAYGEGRPAGNQKPGTIVVDKTVEPGTSCEPFMHYVVPADSLFVMGDNRANSNDSRYWGVVPLDNVVGRVVGIWLPFGRTGAVR